MQTLEIEVDENQVENFKWLLSSIKGIRVKQKNNSSFLEGIKQSERDLKSNNIEIIEDNIDNYIKNLEYEVS